MQLLPCPTTRHSKTKHAGVTATHPEHEGLVQVVGVAPHHPAQARVHQSVPVGMTMLYRVNGVSWHDMLGRYTAQPKLGRTLRMACCAAVRPPHACTAHAPTPLQPHSLVPAGIDAGHVLQPEVPSQVRVLRGSGQMRELCPRETMRVSASMHGSIRRKLQARPGSCMRGAELVHCRHDAGGSKHSVLPMEGACRQ